MCRHAKWFGLLLVIGIPPGCNLIWDLIQPPGTGETGSPELKVFESESELSAYFKRQIEQRNSTYSDFNRGGLEGSAPLDAVDSGATGDAAPEAPSSPALGDDDFSGTTIQEVGVDEADVVKTDGTYLYIIDSVNEGSILRIVQVSPSDQIAVASETTLEGYGRDLYLHGDKIVAITTGGGFYYSFAGGGIADGGLVAEVRQAEGDVPSAGEPGSVEIIGSEPINADESISIAPPFGGDDFVYQRPHTIVTVVDVTSRSGPAVLSQTKFDGTQSATRMIDGVLHMVLANYQDYYFDVMPMLGRPELDVTTVDVNTLLPTYTRVNADGSESSAAVVTWRELYHPTDADGFGVVSLVSLDVDNDAQFTAVGVVAEPGLIYSSLQAMYLTDTNYDLQGNARTTTDIYKFAYANRGATPVATGSVTGRILNQYSMGEHAGNL
ncbi:MAG: beta-propeller domain-containing protein, partial [Planctomycetota bacterium]